MITELKRELQVVRSALAAINSKSQGISIIIFCRSVLNAMIVPKSPLRKVLVRDVTSTPGADHRTDSILTILWNENTNLKSIIQRLGATALAASPLGNQKSDHSSDSSVTHDRLKQIQMKSRSEQTERLVVDLSKTKEQQKWVQLARKPASQLSSQVELLLELSMKYHEALQIVVPCS